MKLLALVLFSATALAQSQLGPVAAPPQNLADLGLSYTLSQDWILATSMMRTQAAAQNLLSTSSVLLAGIYVPQKATRSESSPFFSLVAFHEPHADCKQFLGAIAAELDKQGQTKIASGTQ
jgi:hypothetical protein